MKAVGNATKLSLKFPAAIISGGFLVTVITPVFTVFRYATWFIVQGAWWVPQLEDFLKWLGYSVLLLVWNCSQSADWKFVFNSFCLFFFFFLKDVLVKYQIAEAKWEVVFSEIITLLTVSKTFSACHWVTIVVRQLYSPHLITVHTTPTDLQLRHRHTEVWNWTDWLTENFNHNDFFFLQLRLI